MTSQPTISAVALATTAADRSSALDRLHRLTTAVLNEHVNDGGWCRACEHVVFPCNLAIVAEHNAALL
jgi:hypothetical protein